MVQFYLAPFQVVYRREMKTHVCLTIAHFSTVSTFQSAILVFDLKPFEFVWADVEWLKHFNSIEAFHFSLKRLKSRQLCEKHQCCFFTLLWGVGWLEIKWNYPTLMIWRGFTRFLVLSGALHSTPKQLAFKRRHCSKNIYFVSATWSFAGHDEWCSVQPDCVWGAAGCTGLYMP